jgi:hypothetical protein
MNGGTLESLVVELARLSSERRYGKYGGVVTNNTDPLHIGGIRAIVPGVYGDAVESPWARPCAPYAGPGVGMHVVPPVGARVWVEFEAGDIDRPIWSGGWWDDSDTLSDQTGKPAAAPLKILRSEKGLMVALDDDANTLTLSDADGTNLVTISVDDGKIRLRCSAKVIVEAPKIELTDGATHPVVFGDELMSYFGQLVAIFNSHMHPGETALGIPVSPAPPAPPFTPAPPSLISQRVTTG